MLTRRRFLAISAAGLVAGPAQAMNRLSFRAFGADCTLRLPGSALTARQALQAVQTEIGAVERAFSLYRRDSELSILNRDGEVVASETFRAALDLARSLYRQTGGTFDPGVQAIWQAVAKGEDPQYAPLGLDAVLSNGPKLFFTQPGQALTFNGIAQGLATDRAIRVLRRLGYRNLLANLGEFHALGHRSAGDPWRIGVEHPATREIVAEIRTELTGTAIATSVPQATLVRGRPHIFDPLDRPGERWLSVTVQHADTALADAWSTALAAAPRSLTKAMLSSTSGIREAILIPQNGAAVLWRP